MWGAAYGRYHALDWAAGKSSAEIAAEADACERAAWAARYPWNGVGNVTITWARVDTLRALLAGTINLTAPNGAGDR